MRCQNCSKEVPDDKLFCGYCGAKLGTPPGPPAVEPETETLDQPDLSKPQHPPIDTDAVTRIDQVDAPTEVMAKTPEPEPRERSCPECGKVNPASARFCIACGTKLHAAQEMEPEPAPPVKKTRVKKPRAEKRKKQAAGVSLPRRIPAWSVLLVGVATSLGSLTGSLLQRPDEPFNLMIFLTILGLFMGSAIALMLRQFGWINWWQAAAVAAGPAFIGYTMYHIGLSIVNYSWSLGSMLFEGAIPGVTGLALGIFLFIRSGKWRKALTLGLLWLGSGIISYFSLASVLLYGWFSHLRFSTIVVSVGSLIVNGLLGILLASSLVWLLNRETSDEIKENKPEPGPLWSSTGLVFLGWMLAEFVITTMFSLLDIHYLWPFALMGLIGGAFTVLAFRQFRPIDLPLAAGAVLLWGLLSMLRVYLGVEWGWRLPANLTWFLVSFATLGLSAAGTIILFQPRKPDWRIAGWLGLLWGSAFALSLSSANYLADFSNISFIITIGQVEYNPWVWATPLFTSGAMFFSSHFLHHATDIMKSSVPPDSEQES